MSCDLVWECVSVQSSFLVKRNGVVLTREPNNLTQWNSRKYSGLANKRTVGVTASENGVVLTLRKRQASNQIKPAKAFVNTTLSGKRGSRRVMKAIAAAVGQEGYNAGLVHAAQVRASAILRSQKKVKAE